MHPRIDLSQLVLIYWFFSLTLLSRCGSFHIFKFLVVNVTWSNLLLSVTQVVLKQENF